MCLQFLQNNLLKTSNVFNDSLEKCILIEFKHLLQLIAKIQTIEYINHEIR